MICCRSPSEGSARSDPEQSLAKKSLLGQRRGTDELDQAFFRGVVGFVFDCETGPLLSIPVSPNYDRRQSCRSSNRTALRLLIAWLNHLEKETQGCSLHGLVRIAIESKVECRPLLDRTKKWLKRDCADFPVKKIVRSDDREGGLPDSFCVVVV